jgi:hypothetical protein
MVPGDGEGTVGCWARSGAGASAASAMVIEQIAAIVADDVGLLVRRFVVM